MAKYQGKLKLTDNNGKLVKEIPISSDDGLKWKMHQALPSGNWWSLILDALRELYPTLMGKSKQDLELEVKNADS